MKGWKLFTPLLILAIVAITLYLRLHNPPLLLQGEADATNVIVSSKAKGRVQVLHVRRGDEVKQGDLLISLDSPELEAQLDALHAARNQAQAQLDESLHGTREESIRALKASLAQAEAELRNAESDFQRNQQMVERGFLSRTQFDLSRRERDVARDRVRQGRADVALRELLFPRALAVEDIAEALHHDVPRAEHIRQLANLLRVGDRLVERHGEIM